MLEPCLTDPPCSSHQQFRELQNNIRSRSRGRDRAEGINLIPRGTMRGSSQNGGIHKRRISRPLFGKRRQGGIRQEVDEEAAAPGEASGDDVADDGWPVTEYKNVQYTRDDQKSPARQLHSCAGHLSKKNRAHSLYHFLVEMSDTDLVNFAVEAGLLKKSLENTLCPQCGVRSLKIAGLRSGNGSNYVCSKRDCRKAMSLTESDPDMFLPRVPLRKHIAAYYLLCVLD
jgi:hypothetical protein